MMYLEFNEAVVLNCKRTNLMTHEEKGVIKVKKHFTSDLILPLRESLPNFPVRCLSQVCEILIFPWWTFIFACVHVSQMGFVRPSVREPAWTCTLPWVNICLFVSFLSSLWCNIYGAFFWDSNECCIFIYIFFIRTPFFSAQAGREKEIDTNR